MPNRRVAVAVLLAACAVVGLTTTSPLRAAFGSTPADTTRTGSITAEVDTTACRLPAPACEGFAAGAALAGNATPVMLVVQLPGARPLDNLQRGSFEVRSQFEPPGAPPVAVASCPACFDAKPGGTYTLWLVPSEGSWRAGGYYLRLGVPLYPGLAPALVRVEIPGTPAGSGNRPPFANIVAMPSGEQGSSKPVVFDGSGSGDPDSGDFITLYEWVITSTNPDAAHPNPIVLEGPSASSVSFPSDIDGAFSNVQDLTVTLRVTDDPEAVAQYAAGMPVAFRAQTTIAYRIVPVRCADNTPPVAVIAGATTQQIFGAPGAVANFLVDGTLSSDPETAIETFTWNCGNGSIPIPQGNGSKAVCKYVVDQVPRTFTSTLVTTDRGTGQLVNGQYQCAAESVPASIQVVVSPLAP